MDKDFRIDVKSKKELISIMNTYRIVEDIDEDLQTLTYADFIALLLTEIDIYVGITRIATPDEVEQKDRNEGNEDFVDALNKYVLERHTLRKNIAKDKLERGRK